MEDEVSSSELPSTNEQALKLRSWLNNSMKIKMTDGRTLIGNFSCTDKHRNVILSACSEYLKPPETCDKSEARILGLAMIPGQHIVSIEVKKPSAETA